MTLCLVPAMSCTKLIEPPAMSCKLLIEPPAMYCKQLIRATCYVLYEADWAAWQLPVE